MLRFFQRRKQKKLYQQWVERASLSPDAIPQEEVVEELIPQVDKPQSRLNLLNILFGISLLILCTGLVLLVVYSC